MSSHSEAWLRRQAAQIASQLPEDWAESCTVLDHARRIIDLDRAVKRNEPGERREGFAETPQLTLVGRPVVE